MRQKADSQFENKCKKIIGKPEFKERKYWEYTHCCVSH